GEIDYAVCDRQAALALADSFPQVDLATDIGFTQPQAWAVRKTSPILRDSLNAWFERMRRSGLFESIYKKYYPD
ncbi:MAG: transporter substrate-binding domain-containing protein, partial [Tannerella sp.]|nr:transporter substrate-binding domain-containing protein [Tannerella sp.]